MPPFAAKRFKLSACIPHQRRHHPITRRINLLLTIHHKLEGHAISFQAERV
jgi:hypothetical protein